MPYIKAETRKRKWIGTLIGFPILAFVVAFVLSLILNKNSIAVPAFF